mmetsp:Transcript_14206/g.32990  ORF Transcript_14206/g.32990 Transcript_14206/m.32990 type:complete len:211 (-) Transcript_14206:1165-1797(-)
MIVVPKHIDEFLVVIPSVRSRQTPAPYHAKDTTSTNPHPAPGVARHHEPNRTEPNPTQPDGLIDSCSFGCVFDVGVPGRALEEGAILVRLIPSFLFLRRSFDRCTERHHLFVCLFVCWFVCFFRLFSGPILPRVPRLYRTVPVLVLQIPQLIDRSIDRVGVLQCTARNFSQSGRTTRGPDNLRAVPIAIPDRGSSLPFFEYRGDYRTSAV